MEPLNRHSNLLLRTLLGLLSLAFLWVLLRTAWTCDDAYISYTCAANWVHGDGLTYQPLERVQAFSNPLWTLMMAAIHAFTGEMWLSGMILGIVLSMLLWVFLFWRKEMPKRKRLLFAAMMLLSSAFVDFSTSGLENSLSHLLAVGFAWQFLQDRADGQWLAKVWALGAALMLCRPDLGLLAFPAMMAAWIMTTASGKWRFALLGLAPILAWEMFSLCYYGFLLPNTWYAKLGAGDARLFLLGKGLIYLKDTLLHDSVTALVILLGIPAVIWKGRAKERWLLAGLLLYLLAVLSAGGDFMRGRMFSVAFVLCIFLLMRLNLPKWTSFAGLVLLGLGLWRQDAPVYAGPNYHLGRLENPEKRYPDLITDERAWYWTRVGLWSNHGQERHPARVLEDMAKAHRAGAETGQIDTVRIIGSAGMAGYVRQKQEWLMDIVGLTDPLLSKFPAIHLDWWRPGHCAHLVPPGYMESLRLDSNLMVFEADRAYYDKLRLVSRGELWTWARWRAIWDLNWHPTEGLDFEKYRNGWVTMNLGASAEMPKGKIVLRNWESLQLTWDHAWSTDSIAFGLGLGESVHLDFKRQGQLIESLELPASLGKNESFQYYAFPLPASIRSEGFDEWVIRPKGYTSNLTLDFD